MKWVHNEIPAMSQKAEGRSARFCCSGHRCFIGTWEPSFSLQLRASTSPWGRGCSMLSPGPTLLSTHSLFWALHCPFTSTLVVAEGWWRADCLFRINVVCYHLWKPWEPLHSTQNNTLINCQQLQQVIFSVRDWHEDSYFKFLLLAGVFKLWWWKC